MSDKPVRRCRLCHRPFDGGRARAVHMADEHAIPLPALYGQAKPEVGPVEATVRAIRGTAR